MCCASNTPAVPVTSSVMDYSAANKKDKKQGVRQWSPSDADVDTILENLSEAFATECIAQYFAKDDTPATAKALALAQFKLNMKCMPKAARYYTLESLKGSILAYDLPHEQISLWNQIWNGVIFMLWFLVPISMWFTLSTAEDHADAARVRYMKKHQIKTMIHLYAIGIHPECQGQGLGSLLIKELIKHADATNQHCYLEASTEGSRRCYERHGFVVNETYQMRGDAPLLYLMGRPPKKVNAIVESSQ